MKIGVSVRQAPADFLESALRSGQVDFVEIAIEEFAFRSDKISSRRLHRILDSKPVAVHGYSLSLLDPENEFDTRMKRYFDFMRAHSFINLSDHYAVSSWKGRHLGSLTPAPLGSDAYATLRRKLSRIQSELPGIPFFLENVAAPFLLDSAPRSMVAHFEEALRGTHAGILLDLSNLVANEINFGIRAESELESVSFAKVGEIHLAGGHWEEGFYRDSHSSRVSERSWELLDRVAPNLRDDCLILIEWEQNHPSWTEIEEQIHVAKRIVGL